MTENIRALNGTIQVREAGKGVVKIAGYANKFGKIDSYGTRFDPASVILERFNSNPVLLFNHDVMQPIGKVVKVEKRDDGLFVEAELSNSNAPQVAYVRDLVQEGCLKAFSIRFGDGSAQMEKDPENPGCMLVKNWELQELSIVSLPAQSESLFSLRMAQNLFRNVTNKTEALKVLQTIRGAKAAAYVNECLGKLSDGGMSREEIMERLSEQSGLEAGDLASTLDGDKPLTDAFISAAVDVLNCDKDKLTELNALDLEESKASEQTPADVEPKPIERAEDKLDPVQECVSAKIPMLIKEGKDQEQAVAMAIQMCGEERSCSGWRPNAEQLEMFIRTASASTEPISTPVENTMPNDNAMLQKLDSMVSLLGALVTEIKSFKDEMTKVTKVPEQKSVEIEIKPEEKPEDEPEEMDPEMERSLNALWERVEQKARSVGL